MINGSALMALPHDLRSLLNRSAPCTKSCNHFTGVKPYNSPSAQLHRSKHCSQYLTYIHIHPQVSLSDYSGFTKCTALSVEKC